MSRAYTHPFHLRLPPGFKLAWKHNGQESAERHLDVRVARRVVVDVGLKGRWSSFASSAEDDQRSLVGRLDGTREPVFRLLEGTTSAAPHNTVPINNVYTLLPVQLQLLISSAPTDASVAMTCPRTGTMPSLPARNGRR